MTKCDACNGTGNYGHSGHVDEYGCVGCGGAGYVDWKTRPIQILVLLSYILLVGFLLSL